MNFFGTKGTLFGDKVVPGDNLHQKFHKNGNFFQEKNFSELLYKNITGPPFTTYQKDFRGDTVPLTLLL